MDAEFFLSSVTWKDKVSWFVQLTPSACLVQKSMPLVIVLKEEAVDRHLDIYHSNHNSFLKYLLLVRKQWSMKLMEIVRPK